MVNAKQLVAIGVLLFFISPVSAKDLVDQLYEAVHAGNEGEVDKLIEKKVDLNKLGLSGQPLLLSALRRHRYQIAHLLLNAGANPNAYSTNGRTILIEMVLSAPTEPVEILLKNGADPNLQDKRYKKTALHMAIDFNNLHHLDVLIKAGANLNIVDSRSETPLFLLTRSGYTGYAEFLLKKGANPNIVNIRGATPLAEAIYKSRKDLVKILLKYGANPNLGDSVRKPLYVAFLNDRLDIAKILLEKGADINSKDQGDTRLLRSSLHGNSRHVRFLLEHNAAVDERGKDGMTPLIAATKTGNYSICEMLLKAEADTSLRDNSGKSALDWAIENNYKHIAKLLRGNI
jgi:ankyrin repeat protein